MAPGNMYVGNFVMDGTAGTANFGQKYQWSARPSALSLRYKANVGKIDSNGMLSEEYLEKQEHFAHLRCHCGLVKSTWRFIRHGG